MVSPKGAQHYSFVVSGGGERLDKFLSERLPELSRGRIQELIRCGLVLVNRRQAKPAARLKGGDEVSIVVPAAADEVGLEPVPGPLEVLYESADVVAVNKPAGMAVHPGAGTTGPTLVNFALHAYPEIRAVGSPLRPGVVHRLDKGTSGVVLLARSPRGYDSLRRQFEARAVRKVYIALVVGRLEPAKGIIDEPVGRHPEERTRMAIVRLCGRMARTEYEVKEYACGYTLVRACPITGRTHQIRVHFAAVGHPIAGDPVYGRGAFDLGLSRQFLHAKAVTFVDPGKEEEVTVCSPLAEDLQVAWRSLAGAHAREQ